MFRVLGIYNFGLVKKNLCPNSIQKIIETFCPAKGGFDFTDRKNGLKYALDQQHPAKNRLGIKIEKCLFH